MSEEASAPSTNFPQVWHPEMGSVPPGMVPGMMPPMGVAPLGMPPMMGMMPPPPGFPVAGPVLSSGAVDESSVSAPENKHERYALREEIKSHPQPFDHMYCRFHVTGGQGLYTDHQFQAAYRGYNGRGFPSHHAGWFEDSSGIRHHYRFPDGGISSMRFRKEKHHPDKTKTSRVLSNLLFSLSCCFSSSAGLFSIG